jgi:4,5-dihydroxyphthalate decarboxylase
MTDDDAIGTTVEVHGGDHEHVQGLSGLHGGVRVTYRSTHDINALFSRILASFPYEVSEFSLANYLALLANGNDTLQALPIFPSRAFRHGALIVRRDSP